jgi:metal-responsive CopG/Arc/MetJ family transcriptional regulator
MADLKLVPASVMFPDELLSAMDARAGALDMNRSQYLRWLARQDLAGADAKLPLSIKKRKPAKRTA